MKLSDWLSGTVGRENAAWRVAAHTVRTLSGAADDSFAFGVAEYGEGTGQPLTVTVWAATATGFARADATTKLDPRHDAAQQITAWVETWARIGVLRLDAKGNAEDPLAVTLTVGSAILEGTRRGDADALIELYRTCAGFLSRT